MLLMLEKVFIFIFILAQALLLKGMWWRDGNGNSIRLWKDKWIPKPITYKT